MMKDSQNIFFIVLAIIFVYALCFWANWTESNDDDKSNGFDDFEK